MSNHALITLSDALRHRRAQVGTRWRQLTVGEQTPIVVAHLRKGETHADVAAGLGIDTTTVFRYLTESAEVLTALASTLREAVTIAVRKAFVILDGTLLRIDRGIATAPSGPLPRRTGEEQTMPASVRGRGDRARGQRSIRDGSSPAAAP